MTYLWALLIVAVLGAGMAAAAQVWVSAAQRERERELLFIGEQFRRAIGSYYESTPQAFKRYPRSFEDMIEDRRFPLPKRHLRKIYRDPMLRDTDWGIVRGADKSVIGVYSKARGDALLRKIPATVRLGDAGYASWQFVYDPAVQRSAPRAAAATPPASRAPTGAAVVVPEPIEPSAPKPAAPAPAPVPAAPSVPAAKAEKPNDCVAMRAADLASCARFANDPQAFEVCRRSSNRRYGACIQGGSPPPLVTQ